MNVCGKFSAEVSSPYPCWITIERDGVRMRFHHSELSDLQYLVGRALAEAAIKLGPDARELS
jgi:hypothetical protein